MHTSLAAGAAAATALTLLCGYRRQQTAPVAPDEATRPQAAYSLFSFCRSNSGSGGAPHSAADVAEGEPLSHHPEYPNLPLHAPLTYSLTMQARPRHCRFSPTASACCWTDTLRPDHHVPYATRVSHSVCSARMHARLHACAYLQRGARSRLSMRTHAPATRAVLQECHACTCHLRCASRVPCMQACLSATASERPTFRQLVSLLEDLNAEIESGEYIDASGKVQVCMHGAHACS
jgi:hypothetical protein